MYTELKPNYDGAKSFYGKAYIETWGGWGQNVNLYSYETLVASIGYIVNDDGDEQFVCLLHENWAYSPTTLRHVKEFLQQFGFGKYTKREILQEAIEYGDDLMLVRP